MGSDRKTRTDWLDDKGEAYEKKQNDGIIARRQHGSWQQ